MDTKVNMRWYGEIPSPDIVEKTEEEIGDLLEGGLSCAEDLIHHTVFLTDDMDGPSVFVWGDNETPGVFHCEYVKEVEWVSIKDD